MLLTALQRSRSELVLLLMLLVAAARSEKNGPLPDGKPIAPMRRAPFLCHGNNPDNYPLCCYQSFASLPENIT
jgi:hypothetical protein